MNFSIDVSFIHGFVIGLEYLEAETEDEVNVIALHLPLIRFCFIW